MHRRLLWSALLLGILLASVATTYAQPKAVQRYLKQLQKQARPCPSTPETRQNTQHLFVDSVTALLLNKPQQAYTNLQQALQQDPLNAAIHFKLAQLLQQYPQLADKQKVSVSALTHIYTALALAPYNPFYYTTAVMIHISQNDYTQAIKVYEQMFQRIAPTDDLLLHLAGLYIAQKDHRQAIRVYNQIEQRSGINLMLTQQKQSIYLDMNDLEGAVKEGIKLIQAYPYIEAYTIRLVYLLINNDQGIRAIPHLQQALTLHPGHVQARGYLAYLLLEKGDYEQALTHTQMVMAAANLPLSFKLDLLRHYTQHLPPNATPEVHTAPALALCKAHPQEPQAQSLVGQLYQALGNTDQAHAYYQRALALDETNYDLWHNIIALYGQQNNIAQVQHWAQRALQRFPEEITLYYYLGKAALQQQQYQKAAEALEKGKLLATNPAQTQQFCKHLGDAYQALQQDEQAVACYEAALNITPDDCVVLNNYSYLLALRRANLPLAQEMATKLIQNCPNNANYLDTYAWVLYQLGHYKKAKKYLKKALTLAGKTAPSELIQHYGDVLEQLGQHQEALIQWKYAQEKAAKDNKP